MSMTFREINYTCSVLHGIMLYVHVHVLCVHVSVFMDMFTCKHDMYMKTWYMKTWYMKKCYMYTWSMYAWCICPLLTCQVPEEWPDRQPDTPTPSQAELELLRAKTLALPGLELAEAGADKEEKPAQPTALESPAPAEPASQQHPVRMDAAVYTSTNYSKEWKFLSRVSSGPKAQEFPEIAKAFGSGTKQQQREVLQKFIENGHSLESVEASFVATRELSEVGHKKRKLLTLKQMTDMGFSKIHVFAY